MPSVPPVEDCELLEDRFLRMAEDKDLHPAVCNYYKEYARVRASYNNT